MTAVTPGKNDGTKLLRVENRHCNENNVEPGICNSSAKSGYA